MEMRKSELTGTGARWQPGVLQDRRAGGQEEKDRGHCKFGGARWVGLALIIRHDEESEEKRMSSRKTRQDQEEKNQANI